MRRTDSVLLLVEENSTLRAALRHHLARHFRVKLIEAASADEAVALTGQHLPDVILLDLCLSDSTGTNVIPAVQAIQPTARVIAMVGCLEPPCVDAIVEAGAWACVAKEALGSQLEPHVRRAFSVGNPTVCSLPNRWQTIRSIGHPDTVRHRLLRGWIQVKRVVRWLGANGPWSGKQRIRLP